MEFRKQEQSNTKNNVKKTVLSHLLAGLILGAVAVVAFSYTGLNHVAITAGQPKVYLPKKCSS